MITRREFSTNVVATASVAAAGPMALAAPRFGHAQSARRQCDLIVEALQWSSDGGLTWGNDPVDEGAAVRFRAVIRNAGTASAPTNKIIRTSFKIDGAEVAFNDLMGGLAEGQAVTVLGDDGVTGDGLWFAMPPGALAVMATTDSQNTVRESQESNNSLGSTIQVLEAPPVAVMQDDVASTPTDTPVVIDVMANDTPPEGMELLVSFVESPTAMGGVATIAAGQKLVEYAPPAGFEGEDTFRYEVTAI